MSKPEGPLQRFLEGYLTQKGWRYVKHQQRWAHDDHGDMHTYGEAVIVQMRVESEKFGEYGRSR